MNNFKNKVKGIADRVVGEVKEGVGRMTDNDRLKMRGKMQKMEGRGRETVNRADEKLKKVG
jgi:uncharacterized protein YjbJ (UPF0337 family)